MAVVGGEERWAGQIVWKDDKALRIGMAHTECRPVLQVVKKEWLGNWGIVPTIRYHVTDKEEGGQEMIMFTSHRTFDIAKYFAKKWGDNRLGVGRKFQLVDYTTGISQKSKFMPKTGPVIRVERIRCEPKPQHQTKLLAFLRKNETKGRDDDDYQRAGWLLRKKQTESAKDEKVTDEGESSDDDEDEDTKAMLHSGPVFGSK